METSTPKIAYGPHPADGTPVSMSSCGPVDQPVGPTVKEQLWALPELESHDRYIPINRDQLSNLIGRMLTHIEAIGLPERTEDANKSLVRQSLAAWYNEAEENSLTSYRGCLGPIVVRRHVNGTERQYQWINEPQSVVVSVG